VLASLGLLDIAKIVMQPPYGAYFLVTGPTGSGENTSLRRLIDYVNQNAESTTLLLRKILSVLAMKNIYHETRESDPIPYLQECLVQLCARSDIHFRGSCSG